MKIQETKKKILRALMSEEELKKEVNKGLKRWFKNRNKSDWSKANSLLWEWSKFKNQSFAEACKNFDLLITSKFEDIQELPFSERVVMKNENTRRNEINRKNL